MGENIKLLGEDFQGRDVPSKIDPYELAKIMDWENALNIMGDGVANGTLLVTITVPAGRILTFWGCAFSWNDAGVGAGTPKGIYVVQSNLPTVGGIEVIMQVKEALRNVPQPLDMKPIGQIDNRAGTVPLYLDIYMPQTWNGIISNNQGTCFMSGTAYFSLE